jgi:hypothetical protein
MAWPTPDAETFILDDGITGATKCGFPKVRLRIL